MGRCIISPPLLSEKSKGPLLSLWNMMTRDRTIMVLSGVIFKDPFLNEGVMKRWRSDGAKLDIGMRTKFYILH
jgi:hypothetical protein